jgi:hypothetical protein
VTPAATVTTLAGAPDTISFAESIFVISGIAVDAAGTVYVSEFGSIRKITPDGTVSLLAGVHTIMTPLPDGTNMRSWRFGHTDGVGSDALFQVPSGLAIDSGGNLYVTESSNHAIRKVTQNGTVSTLAGSPAETKPALGSTDVRHYRNHRGESDTGFFRGLERRPLRLPGPKTPPTPRFRRYLRFFERQGCVGRFFRGEDVAP